MNNNCLEIIVSNKTISNLSGNAFGKQLFEQANKELDYTNTIIIKFPNTIKRVAISFIQGYFNEIKKNIGMEGIINNIVVESEIDGLKEKIIEALR